MRILELAEKLVVHCQARRLMVATAESCTGGLIAGALTSIPGSSDLFGYGFVTYSNAAKTELLGVPPGLISAVGPVSEAVAAAMAEGALKRAQADLAVSVTGLAGPEGGTPFTPVGTVWFGLAIKGCPGALRRHRRFTGDRQVVREASVAYALHLLLEGSRQ